MYGLKVGDLMPWHYHDPFFQETPNVFKSDLDVPYLNADLLAMCRNFYAGIGLPIDRVIAKSDLREERQEPARLLHRHRPRGRCARAGQHQAERLLGLDAAARVRPFGLQHQQQQHSAEAAVRPAAGGAHPDHRRRGDDVRTAQQARRLPGEDGHQGGRPQGIRRHRRQDAALSAADLLTLVPGHAAF